MATVYMCILLTVLFVDLERMSIPNIIILLATGFALLMKPFNGFPLIPDPMGWGCISWRMPRLTLVYPSLH